jgi:iron-sulfur cluster assembly protein
MNISFSESAVRKISELITLGCVNRHRIRLAAGCAGCSGITVGLDFDADTQADDDVVTLSSFEILVGKDVREYVDGTKIDFTENEFGGNFIVENPYGSSVCFW